MIRINFENEVDKMVSGKSIQVLQFYERYEQNKMVEYAYILPGQNNDIVYVTSEGDVNHIDKKHLNTFIFNVYNKINQTTLHKSISSKPYYELKIAGRKIPLSLFLIFAYGKPAFNIMNINYLIKDKKDPNAYGCINLNSKYLCLYINENSITSNQEKYFINGILKFNKLKRSGDTLASYLDDIGDFILNRYGSVGFDILSNVKDKFIDSSTLNILKDGGFHTKLGEILGIDMVDMLNQRETKNALDLDNYRLRMSETITALAYNQVHQAMSKLKKNQTLSKEKLTIQSDYIIKNLLNAGILQYTKTLNPMEELMLSMKVVKTGLGNVLKNQLTLNRRDLNPSYFGIISPTATNEYGGIGVNQTLTNSVMIDDKYGNLSKKPFTNISNSFGNLSPIESLSPFFEYDDATRRVMGNQQTAQFTQLKNPDVPLVQTGFESYIPHLVSDRFSKKATKDCEVVRVTDEFIEVKTKTSKEKIDIRPVKSRTKRGIYLMNNYTPRVSAGQKIKKGHILASSDSLKKDKLAIGKNLVVAEMGYLGLNYEDGWVVSDTLDEKYNNTILQKITILFPRDAKLDKLNISLQNTDPGHELIKFNTHHEFQDDDFKDDDEGESIMVGLETRGNTKIYRSPGGVIKDVVVKLNTLKLPKDILSLYDNLIRQTKEKITKCNGQVDCIGHIENIEMLTIGGHKINSEEFDGALIEVYIEQANPIRNGSKFTLTSSGGKGTVQYIMEKGKEPIALDSGLTIEFVGTPLSIISRKNPSILLSMYLGKVIYFLNKKVKDLSDSNKIDEVKKLVLEVMTAIDETQDLQLVSQLKEFFEQSDSNIKKYINKHDPLNNPAFPAMVPPFKNKINIKHIMNAAKIVGVKLNEKVQVVENNNIVTLKEVPVGILPVNLLEHFPKSMSSVRGIINAKRNFITGQGRSGTREGAGAIKVGLYDMNSLLSRQPYKLIKELHAIKSDDLQAKKQMINSIIRHGIIPEDFDVQVQRENISSLKTIEAFFLGAGLQSQI